MVYSIVQYSIVQYSVNSIVQTQYGILQYSIVQCIVLRIEHRFMASTGKPGIITLAAWSYSMKRSITLAFFLRCGTSAIIRSQSSCATTCRHDMPRLEAGIVQVLDGHCVQAVSCVSLAQTSEFTGREDGNDYLPLKTINLLRENGLLCKQLKTEVVCY